MPPAEDGEARRRRQTTEGGAEKPLHIAIIGQPNAGKSTLVNRLIGEERMLTSPEAGTTRDAIAVDWSWRGRKIRLADTAGIRRKAKVVEKLEQLSVGDALKVIRFAEVVVLMMDATEPFEKQDLQLADLVADEGRALVLALNKWDRVADKEARLKTLKLDLEETLTQVRGVPMVPISALSGDGLDRLMQAVLDVHATWNKRLPTAALNRWLAGDDGKAPAARRQRPAHQAQISVAVEDAAADLLSLLLAAGGAAGRLSALHRQRPARGFRARRRADPADGAERGESVRGAEEAEREACSRLRQRGSVARL